MLLLYVARPELLDRESGWGRRKLKLDDDAVRDPHRSPVVTASWTTCS